MSTALDRSRPTLLARLAGLRAPVSRRAYLSAGAALMALKYGVDAGLVYAFTGSWVSPLVYLTPLGALRMELLATAPVWLLPALAVWTLPFVWVGLSMSVRRARDAGLHPAWGLGFLVPFLNYLAIVTLAALPSKAAAPEPAAVTALSGGDRQVAAALVGVAGGALVTVPLVALSTLVLGDYGASLFVGTPFLMSALAGFLYNLRGPRTVLSTVVVGVATQAIGAGMLALFAVEGLICLAMASPLALVVGVAGGLLGRAMARLEDPAGRRALGAPIVALPLFMAAEPPTGHHVERMVETSITVSAPPEAVWDVVLAFPDIPTTPTDPWFFQAGVAMPVRARIEGSGVGAVRHCEFTTGAFVEPITVWDPPHHLAFDVVSQPAPMTELSPWQAVHAPHLTDGTLTSRRGEFRLAATPDGGTRLTGRTWYTVQMAPGAWWALWVEAIVHRVHLRVLGHIGAVAAGRVQ